MPRSRRLEDLLAELHELRAAPTTEAAIAKLKQALAGKTSHAVAKAAEIAGEAELTALVPELAAAFDRLMINPAKADPGCAAKAAIADALYHIGYDDESLFLRGIRHVQLEPVYGGKADTAGPLRGVCALGLVRMNYREVMSALADLLADPEPRVRLAAVRAIAYSENDQGAPLLRLKVLTGDDEPQVISESLQALLRLAPDASLAFVSRLLDGPTTETREAAALALGGSRLPEAFEVLREWWQRTVSVELRRTALLAIAMLRRDQPLEFLLSLVADGNGLDARDAIAALGLYRHDDALRERVVDMVKRRKDIDLREALAEAF
jgi:HEAT repeat protein